LEWVFSARRGDGDDADRRGRGRADLEKEKAHNGSVFVDKAVNQIITAAESAMGEKQSCKATG
jgi:hypothetical protein